MRASLLALVLLTATASPACIQTTTCTLLARAPDIGASVPLVMPAGLKLDGANLTVLFDDVPYAHQATLVTYENEDVVRCDKSTYTTWQWECVATPTPRSLRLDLYFPEAVSHRVEIAVTPVGGPRTVLYKGVATSTVRYTQDKCGDGVEYTWTLKETLASL